MTEDELLAEIIASISTNEPGENEPGTITTIEVAERLGCSRDAAMARMKLLRDRGKVRPDMIYRINEWGKGSHVMGWRLIEISEPKLQ